MVDDFHWTTTALASASCEELRRKVFFGENFRKKTKNNNARTI
jgi:hypothetical protein